MPAEPPHGSKFCDEGLYAFNDADGGEREERAAQAQDAEPEDEGERARRRCRPRRRLNASGQ